MLFADLVGFTALSEDRDAEEVRELLSRYFDLCRRLIARYGGTVEKFIGDAVMAVWGTPTAQEDDAERAVRAALELSAAVSALGAELEAPDLQARVGVLTGEAAVTLGATGEGMVAGDLVNTASRIQSVASPGQVLVGDTTRRTTEAAIAYEDAGLHELKGKDEAAHLFRAVRVIGGRRGALRTAGLEAPFVGREREMRVAKELFHASSEEGRAHLVSVVGVAGVGKTRLSWEFEKYIDGLAQDVWWHRGRCLAYGEGVAYWALAEMVRGRAGILEGEEPDSAISKMRVMLEATIADPEERTWMEPRLAHLLGLEERAAREQADLFSAWRLFFERLAEQEPVEMIFEDLQWADDALLDFIEYQLEWSRDHPIFILTLSRPEIADRRPTWGAGKRNFTSLSLEPLAPEAMQQLMRGLVPGLPEEITARILDRAQGIPLYAVETVRMLLDRGLLSKQNGEYHPTGPVEDLQVPESLHGLIAARLDGLTAEERQLIQEASVLGKTFTRPALAAITDLNESELERLLTKLVRKELLSVQADPRSPERGQYGFLQDLVKRVAYETLSKRDRKARHLAFADYLETSWGGDPDEIVEILASNLLEAYRTAPEAPDAAEIRARARDTIARAGERAASLAANEEAQRYFEQAADLTDDPQAQAGLLERAGQVASMGARLEDATNLMERAIALFQAEGNTHAAARVSARLGEITWMTGRIEEAIERMEHSFEVLSKEEPDEGFASLAAQLGRFLFFVGKTDRAAERLEQALEIAESLWLPEVLSMALNSKGGLVLMSAKSRPREGLALLKESLDLALENDYPSAALRAYYNLANLLYYYDRFEEAAKYARDGLAFAGKMGHRLWEWNFQAELVYMAFLTGNWDDALRDADDIPRLEEDSATRFAAGELVFVKVPLLVARGLLDEAAEALNENALFEKSADLQERTYYQVSKGILLLSQEKFSEALALGREALEARSSLGRVFPGVREGLVIAVEAALALGDVRTAEELLAIPESFGQNDLTTGWRGQIDRLTARLAAERSEQDRVEPQFKAAARYFREINEPYWLAVTLGEHAEWLTAQDRSDEAEPLVA
ncbi:MAG TPA: adenylate/guanylate cyclase domain-containing protein, partial [Actinomycetota bacterium]|nr:adenylate/guanylate cyclase domain-containing protein [Actinomycetota bacterium]